MLMSKADRTETVLKLKLQELNALYYKGKDFFNENILFIYDNYVNKCSI